MAFPARSAALLNPRALWHTTQRGVWTLPPTTQGVSCGTKEYEPMAISRGHSDEVMAAMRAIKALKKLITELLA